MLAVLEVADQGLGHLDMNWVIISIEDVSEIWLSVDIFMTLNPPAVIRIPR